MAENQDPEEENKAQDEQNKKISEEEQLRKDIQDLIDEKLRKLRESGVDEDRRNSQAQYYSDEMLNAGDNVNKLKELHKLLLAEVEGVTVGTRNFGAEVESIIQNLNEVLGQLSSQDNLSNRIVKSFRGISKVANIIADDADLTYVRSSDFMDKQKDILAVHQKRLEAQALEGAQALGIVDTAEAYKRITGEATRLYERNEELAKAAVEARKNGNVTEAEGYESQIQRNEALISEYEKRQVLVKQADEALVKARNKETLTEQELIALKEFTTTTETLSDRDRQRILAAIEFNNETIEGINSFDQLAAAIDESIKREETLNKRMGVTGAIMKSFSTIPGFNAIFKAEDIEHVKDLAREAYVEQQRFANQAKEDKEAILAIEQKIKELEAEDPKGNADQIEILKSAKEYHTEQRNINLQKQKEVELTSRSAIMSKLLGKAFQNLGDALTDPATIFTFLVTKGLQFNSEVVSLAKNLNLTETEATKVRNEITSIAANSMDTAINSERLLKAQGELNKELSLGVQFSGDTLVNFVRLTEKIGLSAQQAAQLTLASASTGESATQFAGKSALAAAQQAKTLGITVNMKEIMEDTANLTNEQLILFGRQPEAIGKTLAEVKKLGIELSDLNAISGKLLDFQGSIESELEAELLTGKQLNLERARAAALAGDQATLAKEIASQVGTISEFESMNVLQRQKLAESLGMNVDQLSGVLIRQEAINNGIAEARDLTDEQLAAAKQLVDSGQAENMAEAVIKINEQRDAQQKFNDAVQKLQRLFGELLAGPVGEVLDAIVDIGSIIIGPIASGLNLLLTPVKMFTEFLTKVPDLLKVAAVALLFFNFDKLIDGANKFRKKLVDPIIIPPPIVPDDPNQKRLPQGPDDPLRLGPGNPDPLPLPPGPPKPLPLPPAPPIPDPENTGGGGGVDPATPEPGTTGGGGVDPATPDPENTGGGGVDPIIPKPEETGGGGIKPKPSITPETPKPEETGGGGGIIPKPDIIPDPQDTKGGGGIIPEGGIPEDFRPQKPGRTDIPEKIEIPCPELEVPCPEIEVIEKPDPSKPDIPTGPAIPEPIASPDIPGPLEGTKDILPSGPIDQSQIIFDERMAGGGRFKNMDTGKMVPESVANEAGVFKPLSTVGATTPLATTGSIDQSQIIFDERMMGGGRFKDMDTGKMVPESVANELGVFKPLAEEEKSLIIKKKEEFEVFKTAVEEQQEILDKQKELVELETDNVQKLTSTGTTDQSTQTVFDERMAGGGRFKDMDTGKMVPAKVAKEGGALQPLEDGKELSENVSSITDSISTAKDNIPDFTDIIEGGDTIASLPEAPDDGSSLREKMKNIAEGLKAFANMEVVKGGLALLVAAPGLYVLGEAGEGLSQLGQVNGEVLKEAMEGIAEGIKAFGDTKVLVGSLGLIIAAPGLYVLGQAGSGIKDIGTIEGELIRESMEGLAEGVKSFGSAKVVLGAIGLTLASPGLVLLGVGSKGLTLLDDIDPEYVKEAMTGVADGVSKFASAKVVLGAIGLTLASPGLLLLGLSARGIKRLDDISADKIEEAMGGVANGVERFASTKVIEGGLNLLIAAPGLLLLGISSIGLRAVEGLNSEAVEESMTGIAEGVAKFSKSEVLLGGLGLLAAAPGILALAIASPGIALIGAVGNLAEKGLKAVGRGIGFFGDNLVRILKGALALTALSVPIAAAAAAFSLLKGVDVGSMLGFTISLGLLAGAAALLGNLLPQILMGAIGLAAVGAAIIPAALAFSLLEGIDVGAMFGFVGALTLLGGVAALLGNIAPFMLAGAIGIAAVGLAIIPAAAAFSMLEGLDPTAMLGFASALGILGMTAAGLSLVGPAIIIGAAALTALSFALIPISKILEIASPGIQTFNEAIKSLDPNQLLGLARALPVLALGLTFFGASLGPIAIASVGLLLVGRALKPIAEMAPQLDLANTAIKGMAASIALLATSLETLDVSKLESLEDLGGNINVTTASVSTVEQTSKAEVATGEPTANEETADPQVFIDNLQPLIAETVTATVNALVPPMVAALKEGQGKVKVVNDNFNASGQRGDINTIRRLPSDNFA